MYRFAYLTSVEAGSLIAVWAVVFKLASVSLSVVRVPLDSLSGESDDSELRFRLREVDVSPISMSASG